uniref:RING-type E3 ubiquitin transferase n=1 Tax=Oryza nivara TaxID=4536 RepID=A0A0E0H2D8_ORYNI
MDLVGAMASLVFLHLLCAGWRMLRMWTAAGWPWPYLAAGRRIWTLGGVRTLDQALRPQCKLCKQKMMAGAVVRALSCDHVFHKACVDERLRNRKHGMRCRICNRVSRCMLPWKASPANLIDHNAQRFQHIRARGGVRTLDRALNDACPICQHRMVARDDVRTLSGGHDFHEDCDIAKWLRDNKKA